MDSNVVHRVAVEKMPAVSATLSGSSVSITGTPSVNVKSFDVTTSMPSLCNGALRIYPDERDISQKIDIPVYVKASDGMTKANFLFSFWGYFASYLGLNQTTIVEFQLINSAATHNYTHVMYIKLKDAAPYVISYVYTVDTISL